MVDEDRLSDPQRLRAIERAALTPNMSVRSIDRHIRLAKALIDAPTVLFSVVDARRQFFPAQTGLPSPWSERGETPLSHSFCQHVVRTGDPFIVVDANRDERVATSLAQRDLGVGSYAGVPVRTPNGQVLGSLCAIDADAREWTDTDVSHLRDLADGLETELEMRAQQTDLEERLAAGQLARESERALRVVASAANRAQTTAAVADELVNRIGPAIHTVLTTIAVVEGDSLHFTHGAGVAEEVADQWPTAPIDADIPMAAAVRNASIVHLTGPDEFRRFHDFWAANQALGLLSFRAVPICDTDGAVLGVIGFGWDRETNIEAFATVIDRIVDVAAAALHRAARFEVEQVHAQVLQRIVLPMDLPRSEAYELASSYVAPATHQRVGGDIYDAVIRDDGALGVLVADAVGHDVMATRAAARLRHAVGVLVLEGLRPGEIMKAVARYVVASPNRRNVTCVIMLFDPQGRRVLTANAGHPPPLFHTGDDVLTIGPVGEPLLGRGPYDYSETETELGDDALVFAYTDGLIDKRDRPFAASEAWLKGVVTAAEPAQPAELIDSLSAIVRAWSVEDDIAMLAVAKRDSGTRIRMRRRAGDLVLSDIRQRLSRWATRNGAEAIDIDLNMAVTELLTNAREAAAPDDEIVLRARRSGSVITLSVTQPGTRFEVDVDMPGPGAIRGRGLALVRAVTRSLTIDSADGLVTIRAEFGLDGAQASS